MQRKISYLLLGNRLLRCLCKLLDGLLVMSQILLTSNQDDRKAMAEMKDLRDPLVLSALLDSPDYFCCDLSYLLLNVLERIRRVNSKADQDNMRIRVRERAETIIIFLACRIPQGEFDVLAIDLYIGNVVLENSGDIDLLNNGVNIPLFLHPIGSLLSCLITSGNVPFENTLLKHQCQQSNDKPTETASE
jgi:hypothetical protein